jgi:hypothetical protein
MTPVCVRCGCRIHPGQLYIPHPKTPTLRRAAGPVHVACPTAHEIAHAKRMGRVP